MKKILLIALAFLSLPAKAQYLLPPAVKVSGTSGNGYYEVSSQSVSPTASSGTLKIYSDSLNRLSWKNSNYRRTIQVPYLGDFTVRMPYKAAPTLADSAAIAALLALKFNTPTGTTLQYIRGDGSLATYSSGTTYTGGRGINVSGSVITQDTAVNMNLIKGLTFTNTATQGSKFFNTSDQVTNTEYLMVNPQSNVHSIGSYATGTGAARALRLGVQNNVGSNTLAGGRVLTFNAVASAVAGTFDFNFGTTGATGSITTINGTATASSGIQNILTLQPQIGQSSTGGYRGLYIPIFNNTNGSGIRKAISTGTTTAANGGGTFTETFGVTDAGVINTAAVTPLTILGSDANGNIVTAPSTGTGNTAVLAVSPTITTPILSSPRVSGDLQFDFGSTHIVMTHGVLAANRIWTMQDATGTIPLWETNNTWSGTNTYPSLSLSTASGGRKITTYTGTTKQWEFGDDGGSNFNIGRYVSGGFIDNPLGINQASGQVTFLSPPFFTTTPGVNDNSAYGATTAYVDRAVTGVRDAILAGTDANQSITAPLQFISLPTITANRTITMPSGSTYTGKSVKIWNRYAGVTYNWSFAGATVLDTMGNTITNLNYASIYVLEFDGTNWIKLN